MEAGILPRMARRPIKLRLDEKRVPITVIIHFYDLLQIAAGSTLVPELLTAAAPKPGIASL